MSHTFRAHMARVVSRVATGVCVPVVVRVGAYSHQSHKPHGLL